MQQMKLDDVRIAMTAAAIAGDSGGLYHMVSGLMGDGIPFDELLFEFLLPLERSLGARWQQGDYLVSEEHAATAAVETVVSILAGSFDLTSDGRRVIVAVAEGDQHSLPARAISAYLLFLGFRTTNLGANVLASDLGEYLESEEPQALVLSCAMSAHLIGARATIRESHRAGVPVLVGGEAFGDSGAWGVALGADAWASSLREVPHILDTWEPDPASSERSAPNPSPDLIQIMGQRSRILADARVAAGTASGTVPTDARLSDELALLLSALESALLVGDGRVAADMIKWQSETLLAHGYSGSDAIVESLRRAIEPHAPSGASLLEQAVQMTDG